MKWRTARTWRTQAQQSPGVPRCFNKINQILISRKSTKRGGNNSTTGFLFFSSSYLEKKTAKTIHTVPGAAIFGFGKTFYRR